MNENIIAFSSTATGYNHIKVDKVCEDASDFYMDDKMRICVVADGHGSDNYPRTERGSRFAVDAAIECIVDFVNNAEPYDVLNDEKNHYELMFQLVTSILRIWYQKIEEDYSKCPFTLDELKKVNEKYKQRYLNPNKNEQRIEKAYGCTMIAFVVTDLYSFGFQIGDGKCVLVDGEANFYEPIPWDDNCQMNVTTSLCDSDARDEFRFYISEGKPAAVFCGSDGIDDSYTSSEELHALYRSILKIFIEHGVDVGKKEVDEYLPVLTKRGSGDDVSIALILDYDKLNILSAVLDKQSELFKIDADIKDRNHQINVLREQKTQIYSKYNKWVEAGRPKVGTESYLHTANSMGVSLELKENELAELMVQRQSVVDAIEDMLYDINQASFVVTEIAEDDSVEDLVEVTVDEAEKIIITEEVAEKTEVMEEQIPDNSEKPINAECIQEEVTQQDITREVINEISDEYLSIASKEDDTNASGSKEEA